MPASSPALPAGARRPGSYAVAGQPGLPLGGQGRVGAQGGHGGVRHRDRAAVAGLDLRPDDEAGGPAHVRRRRRADQAAACSPWPDGDVHQRVPGRVEVDLVDPVAVAVVGPQHRRVARSPRRPTAAPPRCRPGDPSADEARRRRPRPAYRSTASTSARSVPKTSWPTSGGGWFVTSWVGPAHVAYRRGVAAGTERIERAGSQQRAGRAGRASRRSLWRLTKETTAVCFRYRVTGLAAEAGFFALLSLPPLVLGLVGSHRLPRRAGSARTSSTRCRTASSTARGDVLTADVVTDVIDQDPAATSSAAAASTWSRSAS